MAISTARTDILFNCRLATLRTAKSRRAVLGASHWRRPATRPGPGIQPFCAALVAGVIGAIAVHLQVSTSPRLIAVCPCMILVPGPHVLSGALDLLAARIQLGAARLTYAVLIIVAICVGLLLGLGLFGVSLPVDPPGSPVPVWLAAS